MKEKGAVERESGKGRRFPVLCFQFNPFCSQRDMGS